MKFTKSLVLFFLLCSHSHADVAIWTSTTEIDGAYGANPAAARVAADAICATDAKKPASHTNAHAFISFTDTDEIRDMGVNYTMPTTERFVRVDLATQVAADFQSLLNTGTRWLCLQRQFAGQAL